MGFYLTKLMILLFATFSKAELGHYLPCVISRFYLGTVKGSKFTIKKWKNVDPIKPIPGNDVFRFNMTFPIYHEPLSNFLPL